MMRLPSCALIEKRSEYLFAIPSLPEYPGVRDVFICVKIDNTSFSSDGDWEISLDPFKNVELYPASLLYIGYREAYLTYSVEARRLEGLYAAFSREAFEKSRERIKKKANRTKFVFFPLSKAYIYGSVCISGDFRLSEKFIRAKSSGDVVSETSEGVEVRMPRDVPTLEGLTPRLIKKNLKKVN